MEQQSFLIPLMNYFFQFLIVHKHDLIVNIYQQKNEEKRLLS